MKRLILSIGFSALALGAAACTKQGRGDRCQIDSDCQDGLICCYSGSSCSANPQPQIGGQCGSEGSQRDGGATDSSDQIDAPELDAMEVDASAPDSRTIDATTVDVLSPGGDAGN